MLAFKNTTIGYSEPLIKNINTELHQGQLTLLIGNNGVGKTTLMRTILGQIKALKGQILLGGKKIEDYMPLELAKQVSVVFSKAQAPEYYTTRDLISLGKYQYYPYYFELNSKDKEEVEQVIERLGLTQYQDYLLSELSDGNLQKAFIGRALIQQTPMLILDEPTTHLDEENKVMILELLRDIAQRDNKLIFFSSHDWRLAKGFVNTIWWIKDQKIKSGTSHNLKKEIYPKIEDVLGYLE